MNYSQVTVDILQNPKYAGAIDSVGWLTNWIDSGFGMVITIVAFLIILVAMFRNVLAAAYCAYPKFFDRVDAAHKEVESVGWIQQFKDTFITRDVNAGSFSNAILRILPNIKSLTDFEGDTIRPKTYFIRAIPQMLLCIIIGAFIYNGYYRDLAAKVVDFGSEMVSRVLLEVDPIAVYDQFTGSAGRPVFASDNSEIPEQQLVNKISTNVYNAVIGEYNDIKGADAKRALANAIEVKVGTWVTTLAATDPTYVDGESWKSVLQVAITNGEVSIEQINGKSNKDGTIVQYAMQFPVSDLNLSSNINVDLPMYVRVRLNFEKQAVQTGNHSVNDLVLHVSPSTQQIVVPEGANLVLRNTSGEVQATNGDNVLTLKVDYAGDSAGQAIMITSPVGTLSGHFDISKGLALIDSATGRTHTIVAIEFSDVSDVYLTSETETSAGRTSPIDWYTTDLGTTASYKSAPVETITPQE